MFLALKEMRYSKKRYALVISVVVLIAYLVFFLLSLAYGLASANRTAVDAWSADGIVLSDASNITIAISDLDRELLDEIDASEKAPINAMRSVVYRNGDRSDDAKISVSFLGMETDSFIFPELIEGTAPVDEMDVVVSDLLRQINGVEIGDTLEHAQTERIYTVTGITQNYEYSVAPVVYGDIQQFSTAMMAYRAVGDEDAEDAEAAESTESVDAESGATQEVPQRIAGIVIRGTAPTLDNADLRFHTIPELISNLPGYQAQLLTFGLMILFLVLIAGVVIGIFMYILTVQKQSIFGVMKVQGISNRFISKSVLWQSLLISLTGVLIGAGLTVLSAVLLPPSVPIRINWAFFGVIGAFMIIVALLGAIFSVQSVAKIDPLDAIE